MLSNYWPYDFILKSYLNGVALWSEADDGYFNKNV